MTDTPNYTTEEGGSPIQRHFHSRSFEPRATDSSDVFAMLRRRIVLVTAVLISGTLAAGLLTQMLPKKYTATATLAFEQSSSQVSQADNLLMGYDISGALLETEMHVLTSRQFAEVVLDSLKLMDDDPLFAAFHPSGTGASALPEGESTLRQSAISQLLSILSVHRVGDSFAVTVKATHPVPERAAALANGVADVYSEQTLMEQRREIAAAAQQMQTRIDSLAERITTTEQNLARHVKDYRLGSVARNDLQANQQRAQIEQLTAQLEILRNQQQKGDTSSNKNQIEQIQTKIASLEDSLQELTMADMRRRMLEQKLTTYRDRYSRMVDQLVVLEAQMGLQKPKARVISQAEIPSDPSFPRWKMILAAGFAGSAMLSLLAVFLAEELDKKIRSEEQVSKITGLPNFAHIPHTIPHTDGKSPLGRLDVFRYLVDRPASHLAESIRSLLTASIRQNLPDRPTVMMLTSPLPGDGKSLITSGLAVIAVQLGLKVIILDLDLHRSGVSTMMNADLNTNRLQAFINGEIDLPEAIQRANPKIPDLDIIGGGPSSTAPSTLLNSPRAAQMMPKLRQRYDLILLDTPAVLILNDASLLADFVDCGILVVHWGKTTEKACGDAIKRLRANNIPLKGTVINGVKTRGHAVFGYGGNAGYHRYAEKYYAN